MKLIIMVLAVVVYSTGMAQNIDSISVLDIVTVTGIKKQTLRHTPFNVAVLSMRQIQSSVNYSVVDALSKIPGVSQISTGNGISKPVIRGLYGNRIQTVLLGLRFDNQQWQDEHGLGLSIFGIDHIEVLKGPSSLLYGTEAIGGVIKIVDERVPEIHTKVSDVNVSLFSNTLGISVNGGIKKNTGKKNWGLRIGADNHADYSDGNDRRILNSRFESYNIKATLGYVRRKWMNQNHFYSSFSRFGFIMNDNTDRKPVDSRISRRLDGPFHTVLFNILSSENTLQLRNSQLELNGGVHSNLRLENEGGSHISLDMLLNTLSCNVKWYKTFGNNELVLGNETQYQVNTNYGARVIIPDAKLFETALSAYLKKKWEQVDLETGVSISERNIATKYTKNMDYTNGAGFPFAQWYSSVNGNVGVSVNTGKWNLKLNTSTGYRSPNLAELSSNGLHEGTFRFEIGDPGMKAEQNLNSEINVNYESCKVDFYSAVYLNLFRNFIYLSPTGTQLYGFDIYRFLQGNARLYGSEISLRVRPFRKFEIESSFGTVTGKLSSAYLPFIPATKIVADVVFSPHHTFCWRTGTDFLSAQNHPGEFESATGSYWLLHSSFQWTIPGRKNDYRLTVSGDNILNKTYYDHLSRFKYFGIYNIGRSLTATLSIPFKPNK